MEPDFERKNSELFDARRQEIYSSLTHDDINSFMYVFGVNLKSYHHKTKSFEIVQPYASIFKNQWDLDVWIRVTWGTDDLKDENLYEREMDETNLTYYEYLVVNAVKNNRPIWSWYALIGMMQGTLNQSKFELNTADEILTEHMFTRLLGCFPDSFLKNHAKKLETLFLFFDECGYKLTLDDSGIRIEERN